MKGKPVKLMIAIAALGFAALIASSFLRGGTMRRPIPDPPASAPRSVP